MAIDPFTIAAGASAISDWFGGDSERDAQVEANRQAMLHEQQMFDKARAAQEAYLNRIERTQQQGIARTRDLYNPYIQAGLQGLEAYRNEALSGDLSPLYQMQQQEMNRAINNQLARRGLYGSGRGVQMLADNQRRLGAEEANRKIGMQQVLANYGMQGNIGVGNAYQNQGSAMGNALGAMANNVFQGYRGLGQSGAGNLMNIGQANANFAGNMASNIGNLAGMWYYGQQMNQQPSNLYGGVGNQPVTSPYGSIGSPVGLYGTKRF